MRITCSLVEASLDINKQFFSYSSFGSCAIGIIFIIAFVFQLILDWQNDMSPSPKQRYSD